MGNEIMGYFANEADTVPTFDPGLSAPCPFCTLPVRSKPVKTISLMHVGGTRSYFYRAHRDCYEGADEEEIGHFESSFIDSPLHNGLLNAKQPDPPK
jgi:hypothetical protein